MHRRSVAAAMVGLVALLGNMAAASAATDFASMLPGTWQTGDKSQVTIAPCADGWCGVLTHVTLSQDAYSKLSPAEKKAADAQDPKQFLDIQNKDKSLRGRSLIGLQMFTVKASGKPDTFDGSLYNPSDGGTYDGNIRVESDDHLVLTGCMFKILCKSQDWTRLPAPAK